MPFKDLEHEGDEDFLVEDLPSEEDEIQIPKHEALTYCKRCGIALGENNTAKQEADYCIACFEFLDEMQERYLSTENPLIWSEH